MNKKQCQKMCDAMNEAGIQPIPINEAAAEKMLLDEYTRVMGKKPDMPVEMVCKMSAPRLVLGEQWRWVKLENKNWRAQLQFGPTNVDVEARRK